MNIAVGGTVYAAGEFVCQQQVLTEKNSKLKAVNKPPSENAVNWRKISEIGALGSLENGVLMTCWYSILNRFVGCGVGTGTVLIKCALDQVFFASQQDGLFLLLCAYVDQRQLPKAIEEVQLTFLNTWLMDCSLWPVVNFVGFSCVPFTVQPAYMASVQFFWQLYISQIAMRATVDQNDHDLREAELRSMFLAIDLDKNGFIDSTELRQALMAHGKPNITEEEVKQMIADADDQEGGVKDGKVSFEEFEKIMHMGEACKTGQLWSTFSQTHQLAKGAKVAIAKLDTLQHKSLTENNLDANEEFEAKKSRRAALESAAIGGVLLTVSALIRKLYFKL